jgi:hypothetical protein
MLWDILSQVRRLDHFCRVVVVRLIVSLVSQGDSDCCPETGACCQAGMRLPEVFFSAVAFEVGRNPDTNVDAIRLWKGRRVSLFDRSTVWNGFVMADRIRVADSLQVLWELPASLDLQFWMTMAS